MRFTDQAETQLLSEANPLESTFMLADTSDKVDGFFERPQLIFSEEWTPNVSFFHTIDPWNLYFTNSKVAARLSNFHLLRCNLRIKVVINSTPFYYGRMMLSYRPLDFVDYYNVFRDGERADFIEGSQRPNVIIDPAGDESGEMLFPFIYPRSALNVEEEAWNQMGTLTIADLNTLRNSNDATDSVTVSIFAWAENVQYSQPTSVVIPNQGEYEDAAPSGVISKPATTLARLATALANVPIIAPYAKATAMASSAVASIASLFGMSRQRNIQPATYFVPGVFRRLAQTNLQDETDVLALDAKKEVTIDPRVVGCAGDDPMDMLPIAKKETFLTTIPWDVNGPPDQKLYNFFVTPLLYDLTTSSEVHLTPMAWLSVPFRYWRGSITYRFEVVCSCFHRGRLRLVYDPVVQATDEYNVNYSEILDIRDGHDFSMTVGWAQGVPYLEVPPFDFTSAYHSNVTIQSPQQQFMNGVLSLYVLNSLTTPSETTDSVDINVYVSANDDFELQEPNAGRLQGITPRKNGVNPVAPPTGPSPLPVGPSYGNFLNYVQPQNDHMASSIFGPRSTLIGATGTTTLFDGSHTLTLTSLAPAPAPYDMTFTLLTSEYPTGVPGDITITPGTGSPIVKTWSTPSFTRGGLNEIPVTVEIPAGVTSFNLAFDTVAPLAELAITDLLGPFSARAYEVRADDWIVSSVVGASTRETTYNTHWTIQPGAEISINPGISGILARMFIASPGGQSNMRVSVDGIYSAPIITQQTVIPVQNANSLGGGLVTSTFTVLNNGTVPLEVYSAGFRPVPNQGDEEVEVANTPKEQPRLADIFFGEVVVSIRQILKRYTTTAFMSITNDTINRQAFPMMPKGYAIPQLAIPAMSLWDWYVPAFIGWKGSTRVKVLPSTDRREAVCITRVPGGVVDFTRTTQNTNQTNVLNWSGATFGMSDHAPAEAEIPWYSNHRFLPARAAPTNEFFEPVPAYQVESFPSSANGPLEFSRINCAIGEDFSTYMFLCTPIISPSP